MSVDPRTPVLVGAAAVVQKGDDPSQLAEPLDLMEESGRLAADDAGSSILLAELDRPERRRRTVVVVHSDHGEEFYEHGGTGHHSSLFQEQVRVPLFVRVPDVPPRREAEAVGLVGLAPTLLELAGLAPSEPNQGESLRGEPRRRLAMHRSGRDYAVTTDDGWRMLRCGDRAIGTLVAPVRELGGDAALAVLLGGENASL